jgi:hypothetical protein
MSLGFENLKDVLSVVCMPAILALLALAWPYIQEKNRERAFRKLILRELEELSPYPSAVVEDYGKNKAAWTRHITKKFVHQEIFAKVTENRDFILSLSPDLVYLVTQLWDAKATNDHVQWLEFLNRLSAPEYDEHQRIRGNHTKWKKLIESYYPPQEKSESATN